jgi:phosphopantothenoylcysteine decarboxylase / phosphopantothenate---cysteine ligase
MSNLAGKEILLGVSGGIACYKAVEVLRGLKRAGAEVTVVMTAAACEFVQPLTFQTLSNRPVGTTLFDLDQESRIGHIAMAERAQVALVAPCTANVVAKLRAGLADDLLSTVLLATRAPIHLALAMNDGMLLNAATQDNLNVLAQRGFKIIPPEEGFLAEGRNAVGRLADPAKIVAAMEAHFADASAPTPANGMAAALRPLSGRAILVTAGPTLEDIDPVRFLTNRSTGKMGFALAEAARDAGARVTLVSGPVALADPAGMTVKHVRSAEQMRSAVLELLPAQDALILAAAVSDFRAHSVAQQKIKREGKTTLTLELEANPDIAAEVGERRRAGQALVVFAAESQDLIRNAGKKLEKKHADLVVANDITQPGSGFASAQNRITLLRRRDPDRPLALPLMDKRDAARHVLAEVAALFAG